MDGTSFKGSGVGRPWPLLTGERGHYELAAGRDAKPYLCALQEFAVGIGLLPEQVWDQPAIPGKLLTPGGPTGAAIPLVWAHAEYIKLVRSITDRRVFDVVEPVRERYAVGTSTGRVPLEIWTVKRPVASIRRGSRLRIIAGAPFTLRWTANEWHDQQEATGSATTLGVWFADVPPSSSSAARLLLALCVDGTETPAAVDIEQT